MLTPDQLKVASMLLQPLFEQYEDFVIADFARRISNAGEMTQTAQHQANFGASTGVSINKIVAELQRTLKISERELVRIFEKMGITSVLQTNERLTGDGINPIKINELPELEHIVRECIEQTNGTLKNFSNTMGFAKRTADGIMWMKLSDYYIESINFAMLKVRTGVSDYNSAVKMAIKDISRSGLQIIDYESGYHCNIDVAVRRAVLTGLNQMTTLQSLEIMKELETDLVEVTAHEGARPSHKKWQGKVYKLHGSTKAYKNLADATGYGTVSGLKGAYCRHSFDAYVEGMSRTWTNDQLKLIDPPDFKYNGERYTYYKATQQQRAYERRIRQIRREIVGYNEIGYDNEVTEAKILLQQKMREYKIFSKIAGLRAKAERHQVHNL
ncbi:MAG: phage minor capsid protein [Eubacterium sp.]